MVARWLRRWSLCRPRAVFREEMKESEQRRAADKKRSEGLQTAKTRTLVEVLELGLVAMLDQELVVGWKDECEWKTWQKRMQKKRNVPLAPSVPNKRKPMRT